MSSLPFIEMFPALSAVDGLRHGFVLRDPSIDVRTDREAALARLESHHRERLGELGIDRDHLATGQQVHGNAVAACDRDDGPVSTHFPDTDALTTSRPGQYLGVFVADCGAVYFADPVRRACAIAHSGKKGTELGIAPETIRAMRERYGSDPADLVVQLSPCIRPPAYEVDFAARILEDCRNAGVPSGQVHDCGACTSRDPERYYSYRMEEGRTGRLFAVIGFAG